MKPKLYLLAGLLLPCALAAQTQKALLIKEKTGDSLHIAISDLKKFTFAGSQIQIHYKSGQLKTLEMSDIQRMKVAMITLTGIEEIQNDPERIGLYPNPACEYIAIEGPEGKTFDAAIYSANGQQVRTLSGIGYNQPIDIQSLPQGMYILRTADKRQGKFLKQE